MSCRGPRGGGICPQLPPLPPRLVTLARVAVALRGLASGIRSASRCGCVFVPRQPRRLRVTVRSRSCQRGCLVLQLAESAAKQCRVGWGDCSPGCPHSQVASPDQNIPPVEQHLTSWGQLRAVAKWSAPGEGRRALAPPCPAASRVGPAPLNGTTAGGGRGRAGRETLSVPLFPQDLCHGA